MSHIQCSMCKGKGRLWLSGADYLVCPKCENVEVREHKMQLHTRTVYVPGQKPFTVTAPIRSLITDRIIERKD